MLLFRKSFTFSLLLLLFLFLFYYLLPPYASWGSPVLRVNSTGDSSAITSSAGSAYVRIHEGVLSGYLDSVSITFKTNYGTTDGRITLFVDDFDDDSFNTSNGDCALYDANSEALTYSDETYIETEDYPYNSKNVKTFHWTERPIFLNSDCSYIIFVASHYQYGSNFVRYGEYGDPDESISLFSDYDPYVVIYTVDSLGGFTNTRIDSVIPPNATTTATSTSFVFGATGYVNSTDFSDGMRLKMRYYNNKNDLLVGPLIAISDDAKSDGIFIWDITSSGDFEFSTTTALIRKGKHFLTTAIESPRFNFLGFKFFYRTIAATSTWFVVSEYTDYDIITGATTTTPFGITASGNFIFDKAREFAEDLARKVPWGYGYRVYEILTSDVSSEELPNISFTLPSFLAGSGKGISLDPWTSVSDTLAYADTKPGVNFGPFYEQGESIYDSFYRWWRFFWYLAFAFWLFRRLILAYNQGDFDFLGDDGREEWMSRAGDVYTVSELEKMNLKYKAKKSYFKI